MKARHALLMLLTIALIPVHGLAAVETGKPAPGFSLKNLKGETVNLDQYRDKTVVLEWFNNGCPFVRNHYEKGAMPALQKEFADKGVVWLLVASTEKSHQDFLEPDALTKVLEKYGATTVTALYDEDGKIGREYGAKTTPHMYIIDKGNVVYQGAIDNQPDPYADPKEGKNYVRAALTEVLDGKDVTTKETKPYGCSIKYKE